MRSEHINELATALAKAQGSMKPASKSSLNPHFKSKYADLASVWETIREPLSANGLSVVQTLNTDPTAQTTLLYTTLMHSSGQYIGSIQALLPRDKTPQGLAAALTYARRQSLQAIVGVAADEDDDGNEASGRITSQAVGKAIDQQLAKPNPPAPTEAEKREKALATIKQSGWTKGELSKYSKTVFQKESAMELSLEQLELLASVTFASSYPVAIAEFKDGQQDAYDDAAL